ncbi:MAG TPA: hypothetical protein VNJ07_12465, partial [Chitinophagales bacterium]|nr:hypothetical protein [Chitinophagales bacterium]
MKSILKTCLCIGNFCCQTPANRANYLNSAIIMFALLFFSETALTQTTIVNYNFNSGTSYATLNSGAVSGITCTVTGTAAFGTSAGTTSGTNAFTTNSTAGNALNANPNNSWTFTLTGSNLACYTTFGVYYQGKRNTGGDNTLTISYSLNGGAFTSAGITPSTVINMTSSGTWFQAPPYSLPSSVNNPTTSLAIRVTIGNTGSGQVQLDNFQVRATAGTPPTCSISGTQTICAGQSSTFTASGG